MRVLKIRKYGTSFHEFSRALVMAAPSLISLSIERTAAEVIDGNCRPIDILSLPVELFDELLLQLPPLTLQILQEEFQSISLLSRNSIGDDSDVNSNTSRKRARLDNGANEISGVLSSNMFNGEKPEFVLSQFHNETLVHMGKSFNTRWKALYEFRWRCESLPLNVWNRDGEAFPRAPCLENWQQKYCETHVQNCLDEVAAKALLPGFEGSIGSVKISDAILNSIGQRKEENHESYGSSTLAWHCRHFGSFVRDLRLPSVLCLPETLDLLHHSELCSVAFHGVNSTDQVHGICKILNHNKRTLSTLEFIHCKFSADWLNEICGSLCESRDMKHDIMHLSFKSSNFKHYDESDYPVNFLSFLAGGRSLCSLTLSDCALKGNFSTMIFDTLIGSSSNLSSLELSGDTILGGLSHLQYGSGNCLVALKTLNLRDNYLNKNDMRHLKFVLTSTPHLESLDVSENPIEDDGFRNLLSILDDLQISSLTELKVEYCFVSNECFIEMFASLPKWKKPLVSLSIAQSHLDSLGAASLGTYLSGSSLRKLNISGVGLGPSGFLELEKSISTELKLEYLNISLNRGGYGTALFISKILRMAPDLLEVDAGYNFVPAESRDTLYIALKQSTGKLRKLDLTGNWDLRNDTSLGEFKYQDGMQVIILPSPHSSGTSYDHDP